MTDSDYCARDSHGRPLKVGDRVVTPGFKGEAFEGEITEISSPDLVSDDIGSERVCGWQVTVAYDDGETETWESHCDGPWADDLVADVDLIESPVVA